MNTEQDLPQRNLHPYVIHTGEIRAPDSNQHKQGKHIQTPCNRVRDENLI